MGIGLIIMGIGVLHAVFGIVVLQEIWMDILRAGLFNAIGEDPVRRTAIWFELFGLPVIAYGHLIHSFEGGGKTLPTNVKWYLTIILLIGVSFMPASGFWLLLLPLYIIWKRVFGEVNEAKG